MFAYLRTRADNGLDVHLAGRSVSGAQTSDCVTDQVAFVFFLHRYQLVLGLVDHSFAVCAYEEAS